jgi:hypothetical protein
MKRVFTAAGVDYDQWRALTIAGIKLDFRQSSFGIGRFSRDVRGVSVVLGQLVFYTLFGAAMAIAVWVATDLFLAGIVIMTVSLFISGTIVLLDHNSALASPQDYPILGYRPVSSRTYFAFRLTNALIYTTAVTTVAVYLPVVALFVRYGVAVGLAGLIAFYGCSFMVSLGVLTGYASMVRFFGASTIRHALSYIQLGMSFLIYGGYFLLSQSAMARILSGTALPKSPWLLIYPGTWFATYLEIAAGRAGAFEIAGAALSIAGLGLLVAGLGGRMSLAYSEKLGALTTTTQRRRAPQRASRLAFLFRGGEPRAMALLIRTQFRNDLKFRMAVLGVLPLTLLYLIMGLRNGGIGDPFLPARDNGGLSFVTMAIMLFPSMLKAGLGNSDSFRASWVFFACPADRMLLIRASKNVLVTFFLLPYLLIVAGVVAYVVGAVWHVMVHMALLGLLSHLWLQLFVLLDPVLPFSRPPTKGARSATLFPMMFLMMGSSVILQFVAWRVYASPVITVIVFGVIVGVSVAVDMVTRARVAQQARTLEFLG